MTQPNDASKKSPRSFQCRDQLWETFEQMARELECSIDYLINEAMKQYARQRSYGAAGGPGGGRTPFPGARDSGPTDVGQRSVMAAPTAPAVPMARAATPPIPPAAQGSRLPPPPPAAPSGRGLPPPPPAGGRMSSGAAPPPPPPSMSGRGGPPPIPGRQTVPPNMGMTPPPVGTPMAPPMGGHPMPPPPPMQQHMQQHMPPPHMQQQHMPPPPPPPQQQQQQQVQPMQMQQMGHMAAPQPQQYLGALTAIYQGERTSVNKEKFIIGRGRQASDLTIKDPNVSRQHAMIEFQNGVFYMVDLGSTNGVEFHGQRVTRKAIAEGDVFRICDHEVVFTYR